MSIKTHYYIRRITSNTNGNQTVDVECTAAGELRLAY